MIFNTDQGSQFTGSDFTARLESCGIAVSMDGRGRVFDNIFIERLWPTVEYEEVYLHSYETVTEARSSLSRYFDFYNTERLHSSLGNLTPYEVYFKEQRGSHHPVAFPLLAGFSQSPTDDLNKAEEVGQKAKALDSKNPDAQNLLGYICMLRGDYDRAIQEGKQAVELAPNVSDAHALLALSQLFAGQYQESIAGCKRTMRLAPFYPWWFANNLGKAYFCAGL